MTAIGTGASTGDCYGTKTKSAGIPKSSGTSLAGSGRDAADRGKKSFASAELERQSEAFSPCENRTPADAAGEIPVMRSAPTPIPRTPRSHDPEIQRLLLRLHASTNVSGFWTELRGLLQAATPHDALVVYLNFFDFASSWRAAKIIATANATRPTAWFERRREVDMTPQFVLAQRERLKLYRLSDVIPDPRQLRRTAFFQDYLAPGGWHHLAVALFWNGANVCSEIALRRTKAQGDFSESEFRLLQELHPHIETVHNRLIAQEEERVRRRWLEEFSDHLPFAFLILDLALQPVYANREGMETCAAWNFGLREARAYRHRDVFRVPDEILSACRDLKARWLAQPEQRLTEARRFRLRLVHSHHPELVANLTLQTGTATGAAKPGFVVHLSRPAGIHSPEVSGSLPLHSMLAHLTEAEQEIVRGLVAGYSNCEIAALLGKSINTVKGQLTAIYRKIGVPSRGRLLALIR